MQVCVCMYIYMDIYVRRYVLIMYIYILFYEPNLCTRT